LVLFDTSKSEGRIGIFQLLIELVSGYQCRYFASNEDAQCNVNHVV